MCRPFRPENRGNITIPRPYDLGYYVAPFQGLQGREKAYFEQPANLDPENKKQGNIGQTA